MNLILKNIFNRDIDFFLLSILVIVSFIPKAFIIFAVYSSFLFIRFFISFVYTERYTNLQKIILLLFFFLFISFCIFFIREGSYYNALMYVISAFHIYLFLFTHKNCDHITTRRLFKLFTYIIYFQIIYLLIDATNHGFVPGDWAGGTLNDGHTLGVMIAVLIIVRFYDFYFTKRSILRVLDIILLSYGLWLTAANQVFLAIVASFIFVILLNTRYKLKMLALTALPVFFLSGLIISEYGSYFKELKKVPKVAGYFSLLDLYRDEPHTLIFGTSIGTYSSRASVSLSSSKYLAKPQGQQLPVVSTSSYIRNYFSSLYSPDFYNALISAGVTGTFYTPFSTMLSIVSEYGLIGIFILIMIIVQIKRMLTRAYSNDKRYHYQLSTIFCLYFILFFYENWLEYPNANLPFILFILMGLKNNDAG